MVGFIYLSTLCFFSSDISIDLHDNPSDVPAIPTVKIPTSKDSYIGNSRSENKHLYNLVNYLHIIVRFALPIDIYLQDQNTLSQDIPSI